MPFMCALYVLCARLISMPYMYALCLCLLFMPCIPYTPCPTPYAPLPTRSCTPHPTPFTYTYTYTKHPSPGERAGPETDTDGAVLHISAEDVLLD